MTDTRFTTVVDDTEQLLDVVDIDEIGDVETLLMFLFARPVAVEEVWDADRDETSLEVVLQGDDEAISSTFDFPLSVIELVRSCAHTVDDLGPYGVEVLQADDVPNVTALGDDGLITVLQGALGKVRIFNMVGDGEMSE
ncbi:hypothetical protein [Nocardioides sp. T2.26MG-1]|uniref:hypothetical protein n=1 Tax=Nocardioides sp. T2.26MG-1 TaxID=3041166 RepID=UPI0024773B51|nr:hypothetical protein [Nocardioides sp. T2.26MG-1]CAI9413222.1 hypothetical protein HIDPHFAB_01966 [Nocardioides sp. T2.26MG-1]